MISKLPWGGVGGVAGGVGFSELRGEFFVLDDGGFCGGGRLLDVVFEERFGRLLSVRGIRFFVVPRDGDCLNFGRDNLLLCGPGGRGGVCEESVRGGDVLRCWVDGGGLFHYGFVCGGEWCEFVYDRFWLLSRRCKNEAGCLGLFNVNCLLSVDEYLCFYDDFVGGRLLERDYDVGLYKF